MSNPGSTFSGMVAAKPHLVDGKHGVPGEVDDLRQDLKKVVGPMAPLTMDEFTNPIAADTNAIKTSVASNVLAQSYSGTALNGVVGAGTMSPPRNFTVTTDDSATTWQDHVHVTGLDELGNTITEQIALANNTTISSTKPFAKITQIDVDPQADGAGLLEFGFGVSIGVRRLPVARAGAVLIFREIVDGVVVTTGTLTAAKLYTPAAAPNGAHDYALYYEFDPAAA